jgi:hypothetical protein
MTEKQARAQSLGRSPELHRRDFLKAGSLAALSLLFSHETAWACDASMAYLLQQLPEGELMRSPEKVGPLRAKDFHELWSVFTYIGRRWQDGEFSTVKQRGLRDVVRSKTTLTPSYLTEYKEAAEILRCLKAELGEQKALEQMFFVPQGATDFFSSRLGHVRRFVITEFIRYQVLQGAFRKFGYVNYRGFRGGKYSDPARLPYRGLNHA